MSPDGGRVAFLEHPLRFDDRGWVKVVDRAGHVTTLAGEFAGLQGLAWMRDGSTIVFSGNRIRITGRIERYGSVEWFPDGKRLLLCGSEASRAPRCYEQDLAGSPPRPVTAEGVLAILAPDGTTLLLVMPGGKFARSSVDGGPGTPISALHADDRRIGWSRDSLAVFVQHGFDAPAIIERVDLASGQRTTVGQVSAEGVASITQINVKAWVDDGRWYAYNYTTVPSTLFVVSGASGHLPTPRGLFGIGR